MTCRGADGGETAPGAREMASAEPTRRKCAWTQPRVAGPVAGVYSWAEGEEEEEMQGAWGRGGEWGLRFYSKVAGEALGRFRWEMRWLQHQCSHVSRQNSSDPKAPTWKPKATQSFSFLSLAHFPPLLPVFLTRGDITQFHAWFLGLSSTATPTWMSQVPLGFSQGPPPSEHFKNISLKYKISG